MNAESHERSSWIAIGRLLRPQGRRGELLVERATDLRDAFAAGRPVRIAPLNPAGDPVVTTIEDAWEPTGRNAGRIVVKLAGVDTISQAELVAARDLLIREDDLPPLEADSWRVGDLIGCALWDGDTPVGTITGVQYAVGPDEHTRLPDAASLLEVQPEPPALGEPALVPFVKAWLESVDIGHKLVRMRLPAGLLTLDVQPPPLSSE